MKATRTISLNAKTSIVITAEARLINRSYNADGHLVEVGVDLFERVELLAIANGKTVTTARELRKLDPANKFDKQHIDAGAVAIMGNIKLSQATYDAVKPALDECLAEVNTPEIIAYKAERDAMIEASIEADERAEARRAAIYRAMNI
jgi:hypothetical protein